MMITVIVPAYNAEEYIARSLISLTTQATSELEVIVVDDGSTDATRGVANEFCKYPTWRVIEISHEGVSSARNRGLLEASGDYVIFLDADDIVAPNFVQALCSRLERSHADVVAWGWNTVSEDGVLVSDYFENHPPVPSSMSGIEALRRRVVDRSLRIWTGSAAYRREFLLEQRLSYTVGRTCGEDLEFVYRALSRADRVEFMSEVLSFYVRRPGSASNRGEVRRLESVGALKRVYEELCARGEPELEYIASVFRETKLTRNFFYTIESCLRQRNTDDDIDRFLLEVETAFPGMIEEMRGLLRESVDSGKAVPGDQLLFLQSPNRWWRAVRHERLTVPQGASKELPRPAPNL